MYTRLFFFSSFSDWTSVSSIITIWVKLPVPLLATTSFVKIWIHYWINIAKKKNSINHYMKTLTVFYKKHSQKYSYTCQRLCFNVLRKITYIRHNHHGNQSNIMMIYQVFLLQCITLYYSWSSIPPPNFI